ncbi:N-acetylmuramoyl-L-alanine amidase [Bacillus sp. DX1.1]|uniref:N-acetylmuramoyl-L-alanine amidase n=1 Tax=unclassified Bacillus (in: firmicutes) TaxID=185979 RepID=UPI002570161E|nr:MULTISPECIES: N-acetylmuramoyl-L-alanine amidase [unclassified Bacillus (in: firmicutes)]MDM5153293.1 N-acetylmuramoyl-L-alanine amidase [Bacillus sp. DX1.1]WJE82253.1 N-acetylmuramoyl-L-alanine amidase [Bacillus sp. DX3.1]
MKYVITPRYLPVPSKRRSGLQMEKVAFVVAHDTGNPNATAAQNVLYYERSCNEMSASAHLFVDDRDIIECIPALTAKPEKAWHVRYDVPGDNNRFGQNANDAAIGVELCYGTSGKIDNEEAYTRYVSVIAYICNRFSLHPSVSLISHKELDPSRREDPHTAFAYMGKSWGEFVQDVMREFEGTSPAVTVRTGIVEIVADSLNVRKEASFTARIVKVVHKGERYQVFGEENGLYCVGTNEWISTNSQYVKFLSGSQQVANERVRVVEIVADSLYVRSAPSFNARIVKVVHKGESYKVYGEENGLYCVGTDEWISANSKYVK